MSTQIAVRLPDEVVEIVGRAITSQDSGIVLSQLTTHLPFQRGRHHGGTAGGLSAGDSAIQERDDLVGQPNGDLRAHDPMIPN